MDMSQKEEVKALRGLLSNMEKGGKCIPCRIVFFFSFIVFVGVVVFVLVMQMEAQKKLTPVPPELTPPATIEEYHDAMRSLEANFKNQNLKSSAPVQTEGVPDAVVSPLPEKTR